MKKRTTAKDFENLPITRTDIDAGRLVLRTRDANGAIQKITSLQTGDISPKQLAAIRRAAPKAKGKIIASLI